ncbi:MFS transporter [Chimaeribacter coloradensis]|uniref:MFS transporter n=1 Tax=Chimaeribacter coloradensis TaxID=2060068 RepID=A0A2N5E4X6_9GAMM|nr:MFS transporter [Chimaeribacter coloradensis]PLR36038.1 MFS transporter [Chimaeribacter coloradensis]
MPSASLETSTRPAKTGLSPAGAFTLLAIACLTIMVGCVIVPGLPTIAAHLHMSEAAGWLVTLPSLGVVLLGPLAGACIARLGAYRALAVGLCAYGLLGAGGALLHGLPLIVADRVLLGGATALVMAAGTGLLSAFYQGPARLTMIARQGMSIELGGVIFLFLGGVLATLGWRWPFALYLVAWLFLLMLWAWVPRPPEAAEAHAPAGAAGALWRVYAAAFFAMVCFFSAVITLPVRLHVLGLGEAQTGYFLSFVSLVAVAAAWRMPRVVARAGERVTLALAFLAYAAAHLLFAVSAALPLSVTGGVLLGLGFGLSVPLVNHQTVAQSHAAARGKNLARLSMAIFSGQFCASFMALLPGTQPAFWATALLALLLAPLLARR